MKPYNRANIPLVYNLRKEQTKWEKHLWYDFLNKYPVRFQRQKPISNYIVDFYCATAYLAIELDGEYHNYVEQYRDDKIRTNALNKMNIMVLRFNNSEIENEFDKVCKQIDYVVQKRLEELYS